jgi:TRAP-type uncharacterized transport system substrate-binding protein
MAIEKEAEAFLGKHLERLQQKAHIRQWLGGLLVAGLLVAMGYFAYGLLPRQYALTITGGDILGNRHFVAKSLQEEAIRNGVGLRVIPTKGSTEALEMLDQGKLDLALVQGGLEATHPNVEHVATIAPELLHFLVRPEIKEIGDIRGKRVNLGGKSGGTRVVARQVLEFSGLAEGVDYIETNYSAETLISLHASRLPEVIVLTSFAPSHTVDFLVKEHGMTLLEIPFPNSLAARLGWVADSRILAYMYSVTPPVPAKDIKTVGVNLHLLANRNVDPDAINKVLKTLYGPELETRLKMKLDEGQLTLPSGYHLSKGAKLFMARNDPILSADSMNKLKSLLGILMSLASVLLVSFKWFKGEPTKPVTQDALFAELSAAGDGDRNRVRSVGQGRQGQPGGGGRTSGETGGAQGGGPDSPAQGAIRQPATAAESVAGDHGCAGCPWGDSVIPGTDENPGFVIRTSTACK